MNGIHHRKKLLEDELRQVIEQKAAIQRQLEVLRGGRASAKPVHSTPASRGGTKRPGDVAFGADTPAQKKQRFEAERAKRVNSLWAQCVTILRSLKKGKDAHPFLLPVDPVKLNCLGKLSQAI
jgi:hypothetical protein